MLRWLCVFTILNLLLFIMIYLIASLFYSTFNFQSWGWVGIKVLLQFASECQLVILPLSIYITVRLTECNNKSFFTEESLLKIGDVRSIDNDPFTSTAAKVLDIKNGYVQYKLERNGAILSSSIEYFIKVYEWKQ